MSSIEESLLQDEQVIYAVRLHWISFMPAFLCFVLAIFATLNKGQPLDGILYLISALLIIVALVNYLSSEFALTNKRVIIKAGLISRNSYDLLLSRIEGIDVEQSILGRIFGYGNFIMRGTGGTKEILTKIENPIQFRRKLQEQIAELQTPVK